MFVCCIMIEPPRQVLDVYCEDINFNRMPRSGRRRGLECEPPDSWNLNPSLYAPSQAQECGKVRQSNRMPRKSPPGTPSEESFWKPASLFGGWKRNLKGALVVLHGRWEMHFFCTFLKS